MLACAALLAAALSQTPGALTVEDELRRAKNEYAYGDYEQAAELLRGLLYPMRLYADEQVVEARKVLGLSSYLVGREGEAREEFTKLLYLSPDFELDPFTIAPPIVEMFERLRRELKPELDVIRQRDANKKQKEPVPGYRRTVRTTIVEKSDLATLMPFGVGQFQNGDTLWGATFALAELALLVLNVGSYLWARDVKYQTRVADQNHGYGADQRELVQALTLTQYASAALLGVVWSVGVFHARLRFVPLERSRVVSDEPNDASASGRGALGALLSVSF